MIRVTLLELLRDRNKSLYWLAKQTHVSYPTLHRLATKPVQKVDLLIAEKICRALGCGIEELLVLSEGEMWGPPPTS